MVSQRSLNEYDSKLPQHIKRMLEMIMKLHRYVDWVTYEQFCDDEMCRDACITVLTQLWELSNTIKKYEYQPYNIALPVKEMTEMRNFLVHSYHRVDIDILWKTIQQSIPSLEKKLQNIW